MAQSKAQEKYRLTDKYIRTRRNNSLKRTYGITLDDYNLMLLEQNYKCKICQKTNMGRKNHKTLNRPFAELMVDHCHTTNKVRGLLCHQCNLALGMFEDNVEIMIKAINYIKENQS